jgi:hypothetical protein
MPIREKIVRCDCGDTLEQLGETNNHVGAQYGDHVSYSIFYQCKGQCGKIFVEQCNGCHENYFVDYNGNLPPEELRKYALEFTGHWDIDAEMDIIAIVRSAEWQSEVTADGCVVHELVPICLAGKRFVIKLVKG